MISTQKPYLINAIYEWCSDYSYSPYLTIYVNDDVQVPHQYVENNKITLDITFGATKNLVIDKDGISFSASFSGVVHQIFTPIDNVIAIFAKENGHGMQFQVIPSSLDKPKGSGELRLVK